MEKKRGRPNQRERFIAKAKELGADESGEKFERAFEKIAPPVKKEGASRPPPKRTTRSRHDAG